ncbi:MAG: heavy-metal-associated domain-containing protein [Prevotella sp.]|nr:heavy-metal-associated domain-containing protein [Prevotella sp.]
MLTATLATTTAATRQEQNHAASTTQSQQTRAKSKEVKTLRVTTLPQMHCDNCEKKIKGNLRFEKGVKKIDTNIPTQTVTIEYDASKTSPEKLLKAFTKFGYEARQLKEGESVKAH